MKSALFLVLTLGLQLSVEAQWIVGVTNRGVYTDSVTFSVPAAAGFTDEVTLNQVPVAAGVPHTVSTMDYYDLVVRRTPVSAGTVSTQAVRFIVISSRRGSPDLGLIEWTPYPPIPSGRAEFAGGSLVLIAPSSYPPELEIPIVAWVDDGPGYARRVNGTVRADGLALPLYRGVGHAFHPPGLPHIPVNLDARVQTLSATKSVQIDATTSWQIVSGLLPAEAIWPPNSRIHVTGDITVSAGNTLTIGAGTIVLLDPSVNITNSGRTRINGTIDAPVVLTARNRVAPEQHAGAWGGFLLRGASAELIAQGTIMTGAGASTKFSFTPAASHRPEQALLLVHSGAKAFLTNCFLINNAGQIGNGYNSDVTFDHCLLQRAITGGEYEGGTVIVNHSAVIEFPSIDGVYNATIADADYDAIYFTTGTHILQNSLFGFAKDDAIDSGSGGAGTVVVTNCWVESALHEALAWSGGNRQTWSYDSVLINCGQGIECGWSSGTNSPLCHGERLLSLANSVGARFGDNYQGTTGLGLKTGFLTVTNSVLIHNYRDVFGRAWDDTWDYRASRMAIEDNFLSAPNPFHPHNQIWNASTDAPRLLPFMRLPPGAAVGIGFAHWNPPRLATLSQGIPVRLSTFTTNEVTVDYTVETADHILASGTLQFRPGETVQPIISPRDGLSNDELVRVSLHSPRGAEITTDSQLLILPEGGSSLPIVLIPFNSNWKYLDDGSDQDVAWRNNAFNDTSWSAGPAQLGFGDNDEATQLRRIGSLGKTNITFYFRKSFPLEAPATLSSLQLRLLRDDAGVVYLNGSEVFRSPNLPAPPTAIAFTTHATATGENTIDTTSIPIDRLRTGENIVAVEIHQEAITSSDVSFDLELIGVPAAAPPRLNIARFGQETFLYWQEPTLHLQVADEISAPASWQTLDPAASPFALSLNARARFYRLSQ